MPDADFRDCWLNCVAPRLAAGGRRLGYARRYGTRAEKLLDGARSLGDLGRHFGATLYEREARFLIAEEWAEEADDILSGAPSTAFI